MVRFSIVSKIIGQLLFLEAAMMMVCLVMAICYREDDVMAFLISMVFTVCGGLVFKFYGRNAGNELNRREAYLVVALIWVVFCAFGMLPLLISGYVPSVTDAYFETMSGFTTTGATIIDDVECLPHTILFWRSLTHWIGGLGIVFFTIAILPSVVGGSIKVFAAESTGPMQTKMHPRLSTDAKWIWMVYLAITAACVLSFRVAGMGLFDCVCYSMSIAGTGGFATHNDSLAHFGSPAIEYIGTLFQFLAGMNFTLIYVVLFKGQIKKLFINSEFKLYCWVIAVSTALIAYFLVSRSGYELDDAVRHALFQTVTFITTTGMFSDDAGLWPHFTWVVLGFCMFIGSCAGSTSGGFKCIRGVMVLKIIRNELRQILHPNAVLPIKINRQNIQMSHVPSLLAFFVTYILICLFASTVIILSGVDDTNSITIALSSISNVGPALGKTIGPTMSWSSLPEGVKWLCSLLMLIGRLEIMTVLVLFTRGFWKEN